MKNYLEEYNNQVIEVMSEDERIANSNYSFYTVDATISFRPENDNGDGDDCCGCLSNPCCWVICYEGVSVCSNFACQQECWWIPSITYTYCYHESSPELQAEVHPPILWYLIPFFKKLSNVCCCFSLFSECWNECCYSEKCFCKCCQLCCCCGAD